MGRRECAPRTAPPNTAPAELVLAHRTIKARPPRLHDALDRAHIAHEWLYERTEGHGFYDESHRAELLAKIAAFLDANIGDEAEASSTHPN